MDDFESADPSKLIQLCDRAITAADDESRKSAIDQILAYLTDQRSKRELLKKAAAN